MSTPNQLFDPRLARLRRARAARSGEEPYFLHRHVAKDMLERLDLVSREFSTALDFSIDPWLAEQLRARGIVVSRFDEESLPAAAGPFDLTVSLGLLDLVNDLPGALTLVRRALKPDGLFLAAFAGAGSLPRLRRAMRAAEEAAGIGASPHIHPQIDVRAAGDLLTRAGFALPVVDRDVLDVRYGSLGALVADLRAMGATNRLAGQSASPIGKRGLEAAIADFADGDGETVERFEIVYLSGWAPGPDQPRPAPRGSAAASLADALKPRR